VSRFADMRRFALPLVIMVAVAAIAVPTCRMVGCDMDMGSMPLMPFNGPIVSSACGGQWEFSSGPAGILPSGTDALSLTLMAAFAVAVVLLAPQVAGHPVLVRVSNPPPPPEDPLGERFRV